MDLYLHDSMCVSDCPPGQYENTSSLTCMSCARFSHCNECSQESCLACAQGFFLSRDRNCVDTCEASFYMDCEDGVRTCKSCSSAYCTRCDSASECTATPRCSKCVTNRFLHQAACLDKCPVGYFGQIQGGQGECARCPQGCRSCRRADECEQCDTGLLQLGVCRTSCSSQQFY